MKRLRLLFACLLCLVAGLLLQAQPAPVLADPTTGAIFRPSAISGNLVGTTATQTLTNKTLTSPTLGGTSVFRATGTDPYTWFVQFQNSSGTRKFSVAEDGAPWVPSGTYAIWSGPSSPTTSGFHIIGRTTNHYTSAVAMELATIDGFEFLINNAAASAQRVAIQIANAKNTPEIILGGVVRLGNSQPSGDYTPGSLGANDSSGNSYMEIDSTSFVYGPVTITKATGNTTWTSGVPQWNARTLKFGASNQWTVVGGDASAFTFSGGSSNTLSLGWSNADNMAIDYASVVNTGTFRERSRAVAMGDWAAPSFSAGDYTANTGTWTVAAGDVSTLRYSVVGKTMTVAFRIATTTVAGTPAQLRIAIPGGFIAARDMLVPSMIYSENAETSSAVGLVRLISTQATLFLYKDYNGATWANSTDQTYVTGTVAFEVQ